MARLKGRSLGWLVRFGLVAASSELVYLGLYALVLVMRGSPLMAISLAGGFCLLLNSYLHARVTFRVRFAWSLMVGYVLIQLLGYGLGVAVTMALATMKVGTLAIAVISWIVWGLTSLMFTPLLYSSPGAAVVDRLSLGRNNDRASGRPNRSGSRRNQEQAHRRP